MVVAVDDPAEPRLDDVRNLTDVPYRRAYERERGVLVAEGPKVVAVLLRSEVRTRFVLTVPSRLPAVRDLVGARGVPIYVAEPEVVRQVVGFRLSRGVVAAADRPPPRTVPAVLADAQRILVLEETNDADNLGGLFRTARALDADAILLGPRCADPLYRRTVRVSMGHVLGVPFASVTDPADAVELLHDHGFDTVALTPSPSAAPLQDLPRDRPVALLLGAEGPGLSEPLLRAATHRARIAISDSVDSLNVVVAAGIALHVLRPVEL